MIVYTEYPGQAPQVVEDQVTYPLTSAMLTVPRSKVVRGFSFFGVSFVYIIFEDGTDIYWARSRVLEYLNAAAGRLAGRRDAERSAPTRPASAGSTNMRVVAKDMNARRTALASRTGRSATGSPRRKAWPRSPASAASSSSTTSSSIRSRLRALGIPLSKMREAIRASNTDVGGRTVELSEFEYMVRGRGYLRGIADIEQIVVQGRQRHAGAAAATWRASSSARTSGAASPNSTARARWRAASRCSATARTRSTVIDNVKKRARPKSAPSLPKGVKIVPVYDRSKLIHARHRHARRDTLIEESVIVALVCVVFLLHVRSALVAIIMLPVGVLMAFAAMQVLGLGSNIMSLGGIAIAIGAMVDAAIVMIENAHKHLERAAARQAAHRSADRGGERSRAGAVLQPAGHHRVVPADLHAGGAGGPAVQAARLHQDLLDGGGGAAVGDAGAGADGAVRPRPDHARAQNPINRVLIWIYRPVIRAVAARRRL